MDSADIPKRVSRCCAGNVTRFWNRLMSDDAAEMKDRLKASEFLAKFFDLYADRAEGGTDGVAVRVVYDEGDKK